jgi:hypothetical protein
LEVTVDSDYGRTPCSADLRPTTYVLAVPDALLGGAVLTVRLLWGKDALVLVVPRPKA